MHHVFVSYARVDRERVDMVVERLLAAKVPVWIDRSDIAASTDWQRELEKAIVASAFVAVFDSPAWLASENCQEELEHARAAGKKDVRVSVAPVFDAQAAAEAIIAALRGYTREERARTELVVRSGEWAARDRSSALLAPRALAKELRIAGRRSPVMDAFLSASARRNALRRTLTVVGSLLTVALLGLVYVAPKVLGGADDRIRAATASLVDHVRGYDTAHYNVYAGMALAADGITDDAGYLDLVTLMTALDAEVPDRNGLLEARTVAGLLPRSAETVGVVSTTGLLGDHERDGDVAAAVLGPGETVTAVASDPGGTTTVVATPGLSTFADGTTGDCGGSTAAAGADGSRAVADAARICVWPPGASVPDLILRGDATALGLGAGTLYVGASDGTVTAQPLRGGPPAELVSATGTRVSTLAVSGDGQLLAVAHADDAVLDLVDPGTGAVLRSVLLEQPPTTVAFNPTGRVLAAAVGPRVEIVDVGAGAVQQTLVGSFRALTALSWSPDGAHVWAATEQHRVLRWTWRHGTVLLDDPSTWITNQVSLPDGAVLALTRDGALLRITADGQVTREQTTAGQAIALAASPDGSTAAVLSGGDVVLHRMGAAEDRTWPVSDCSLDNSAFSRDGQHLYLACGADGLAILDVSTGEVVRRAATGPGVLPTSLAVGPDGTVVVGGAHGDVLEVSADLSRTTVVHGEDGTACPAPRRAVSVSPDGSSVVAVGDGGTRIGCVLLATRDGDSWETGAIPFQSTDARQARAVTFSPDGNLAAIGFGDGSVALMTVPTGNPRWTWHEPTGAVRGLAFSADGQSLTVATRDGLVLSMAACPSCDSPTALAALAEARVQQARDWGLTR